MARWVCYVAAIAMTFAASLLYLSWAYEEPGFGLGEVELQPLSEHDWMRFLLRRSVPLPALNSSLEPWRRRPESLFLQTSHPALLQYPPLPYDDAIACLPRKFGYTQEQADALFSPSRRYPPCGDPLAATTRLEGK